MWLPRHALSKGHVFWCFHAWHPTRVSQLFCLTNHIKVINIMKLDVWVSSYRHTDPSSLHILRTIWLQQGNHTFRHYLYFPLSLLLLEIMALCRSVTKDNNILCELLADTYSEVRWLWNRNFGQWQWPWPPHNSSMQTTAICLLFFTSESENKNSTKKKVVNWTALIIKPTRKHKMQTGYSKYGLCMNTSYRNSDLFTTQRSHVMKPQSHGTVTWSLGCAIQWK